MDKDNKKLKLAELRDYSFDQDRDVKAVRKVIERKGLALSEPEPIFDGNPDNDNYSSLKPFPTNLLVKPFADFIEGVSKATPCPPDFVGVPALVMAGTMIGNSRLLKVKGRWKEPGRLWATVVAEAGDIKSPVFKDAVLFPAERIQDKYHEEYMRRDEEYEIELEEYEECLAEWKKSKNKSGVLPQDRPTRPVKPVYKQIFTTNSTTEAIEDIVKANPRGFVFFADELKGWATALNQYKGGVGNDRASWLSFWAGTSDMKNRKGIDIPNYTKNVFLPLVGGIQPEVLKKFISQDLKEKGNDGLFDRFLFCYPDSVDALITDYEVDESVYEEYFHVLKKLQELSFDDNKPKVLTFTPKAQEIFTLWNNHQHVSEQKQANFNPILKGVWSKMKGYTVSLALIIHYLRFVCGEVKNEDKVDEDSLIIAIEFINYFKSQAVKVYSMVQSSEMDSIVSKAVEKLKKCGGSATFQDILKGKWCGCKTAESVRILAEKVASYGYARIEPIKHRNNKINYVLVLNHD